MAHGTELASKDLQQLTHVLRQAITLEELLAMLNAHISTLELYTPYEQDQEENYISVEFAGRCMCLVIGMQLMFISE